MTALWAGHGPQALAAVVAAGVLLALLVPVPAVVLDTLLALSLGAAAGVLLVALMADEPTRVGTLPSVLVLSSLARIVLCLCVTRLILVAGEGGGLVTTLGGLVSGADAVAGVGLLIVLAVVQLVMVTAGVGRIAEVAARFALDALPGKQMGLDTALSQGQVSPAEARGEVQRLEQEANFYGAMDGASRFLRGEAVATVVIVLLTAAGGGLRAVAAGNAAEVARHYGLLATGQGLVTILPALLMGAAAAVMVSRAASGAGLMVDVASQGLLSSWPLAAGAVVLLVLGVVPGVAKVPTLVTGAALALGAWWLSRSRPRSAMVGGQPSSERETEAAQAAGESELSIELGMGLLGLIEEAGNLTELLPAVRAELSDSLGLTVPPIAVRDSLELGATEYRIVFRAATLGRGIVRPQRLLAVAPRAGVTPDAGMPAELADGRSGVWVTDEDAATLAERGYALLSPAEAIAENLRTALRRRAADVFDLERAAQLLRQLETTHPGAMREARSAGLTAALMSQVGGVLLRAGVPLRDPLSVVEGLAEALPEERDPERLALRVRPRLAGMMADYLARDGRLRAVELAPELEDELARSAYRSGEATVAALPPERAAAWVQALDQLGKEYGWGQRLAVICDPKCLQPLQSLCAQVQAELIALQPADLTGTAEVEFLTRLSPESLAAVSDR